ncbi:MAG: triphosphoribosyl-dephospho-CoA synthetase [Planctomycetes bacterium]|nr:triphosphoribosyl-dephospho-CoA synthetase [Planctomycetota bacterium]
MFNPSREAACLSVGQCATLACLLEASVAKPGNVHPGAEFADLSFRDFVLSAVAIGPAMDGASTSGVGTAVLAAVRATRSVVPTNTNLGTVLLLAPLASVPRDRSLRAGVRDVLAAMTAADAAAVYDAIRLTRPGGLGTVRDMDVAGHPPETLLLAMQAAADRDMVARQYVTDFSAVFDEVVAELAQGAVVRQWPLAAAVIHVQMQLLQRFPDSLIARKCGPRVAEEAAMRAARVLASGQPGEAGYAAALAEFDVWLRADQHRRNPGTTADLIAAGLFVALRDKILKPPFRP